MIKKNTFKRINEYKKVKRDKWGFSGKLNLKNLVSTNLESQRVKRAETMWNQTINKQVFHSGKW